MVQNTANNKCFSLPWVPIYGCYLVAQLLLTLFDPRLHGPQAPLSMRFPRQEYWRELPFLSPRDLPDPGIKLRSSALAGGFSTTEPPGKPLDSYIPFIKELRPLLEPEREGGHPRTEGSSESCFLSSGTDLSAQLCSQCSEVKLRKLDSTVVIGTGGCSDTAGRGCRAVSNKQNSDTSAGEGMSFVG